MKVLLVDDDRYVINVMKTTMDWASLGFSGVLTAYNMRQAQAVLEGEDIDLVISDIEMPQGSGLDLLAWVRERDRPAPEFIFLTNYADFNYAQKAIELKSFDYYLKPVVPAKFTPVIEKAVAKIRQDQHKERHGESKAEVRQRWQQIFFEPTKPLDQLLPDDASYYLFAAVQPERQRDGQILHHLLDKNALPPEHDGLHALTYIFERDEQLIFVYEMAKDDQLFQDLQTRHLALGQAIKRTINAENVNAAIYISTITPRDKIRAVVARLANMVRQMAVHRNSINLLSDYHPSQVEYVEPSLAVIGQEIERKDQAALLAYCREYLTGCEREHRLSKHTMRNFREDLVQQIYVQLQRHNVQAHKLFSSRDYTTMYYNSLTSVEMLLDFVAYVCGEAFSYAKFADSSISVARQLQKYIDHHLNEELTRDNLAEIVYLNPDYSAKLFKDEFGISMTNYIIRRRITMAEELVASSAQPINQIAESLGYTNFSYFTRLFKRETGMTPMGYRRKNSGGK
ncbi:response regulator [Lacticaseibacillus mingshuiensis]|uniref:Response regulator n=1 Tax=Lacticaseibacillus mingshuiensis TaxID=2799574 RepID=A0ABW4CHS6_9LACO|nr:response regulator [Lacticaseibacillus mingshuiensis]